MSRVTLQTIADRVGVSRTTVSNAFSRPDQLTADLRERILAVATELGYAGPNAAARTLRRGRADAIGLVFTETLAYAFADPYAVEFLRGIAESCERAGIGLLLVPLNTRRPVHEVVQDAVVDGFCVFSLPDEHPAIEVMLQRQLPVVLVDEPYRAELPFVGIDDRTAARTAGEHVMSLGHERVGVVATLHDGHEGWVAPDLLDRTGFGATRARITGYREACTAAGLDWSAVPVYQTQSSSRDSGRRAGAQLLDRHPRPTVILAMSDQVALGVMDAAADRGLEVPRHVSVVGFDDIQAAAAAGLTTVRQPMADKGRAAGRLLLETATNGSAPHIVMPHELVVRSSTGPPP